MTKKTNGFVVAASPIHGRGLFASHEISEGERIGAYEGPEVEQDSAHVLWIEDEDGLLRGIRGENELRFVNHSPLPNAAFEGPELFAMRRIAGGEEITIHYGDEWDDLA